MVPIARDTGSVIAFGGRALEKDQVPKYLNSPETALYNKSRTLYGLNLTKGEIRKRGFAIVVEGYFDFAQVFQAGGLPVVATCGTALTVPQAQHLRRFASKAVLCYDPDSAGQTAAGRSSELLVGEGFDVNVVRLPERTGPRHIRPAPRRRSVRPAAEDLAAVPRVPARPCRRRARTSRGTSHGVNSCAPCSAVAARIPDPATRDQFADRLAHKARVTEEVVRAEIRKAAAARKTELPAARVPMLGGHLRPAERGLLWGLVHQPERVLPSVLTLEDADLEGLSSSRPIQAGAGDSGRRSGRCSQIS